MSVLDINERYAYLESPYYKGPEYSDFTPFYVTIAVCTVLGISIFALNIILGCCSKYSDYWNDRHTGNRWLISLWTATPHNQPALDYSELDPSVVPQVVVESPKDVTVYSDVEFPRAELQEQLQRGAHTSYHHSTEYLELHHQKSKESDI